LDKPPEGEWFCPKCEKEVEAEPEEGERETMGKGVEKDTPKKGGKRKSLEQSNAKGKGTDYMRFEDMLILIGSGKKRR